MMTLPIETTNELLRRHEITPPPTDAPARHTDLTVGQELTIGGHTEGDGPKTLTLTVGTFSQSRSCPLSEDEAHDMVARLQERHALPHRHAEASALQHLLQKSAAMYAESAIASFVMHPVYLNERGYRIGHVQMFAAKHVTITPRLDPHAHDRKAVFAHRPTDTK